jgi:folate-binding protein YgfZ
MPRLRDLSPRTKLILTGDDRVRFLHGMVTNDIEALRPGQGCHAAMLTTKGKMVADLVVYCDAEALLLEMDPSLREKVKGIFDKHIIMDDVVVEDVTDDVRELGVYGEDAAEAIARGLGVDAAGLAGLAGLENYAFVEVASAGAGSGEGAGNGKVRVARAPELGVPGFHVIGGGAGLAAAIGGEPLGDDELEEWRIEAGTPLYGIDMGEDRLPIEAGVTDAVSFTKGCYLGQEVIARATNLGHINRRLVGLVVDGDDVVARGAKLSAPTRAEAGVVTSSARSRRLGRVIALAYVHRTLWDQGTEVEVAGRRARVVTLPFAG